MFGVRRCRSVRKERTQGWPSARLRPATRYSRQYRNSPNMELCLKERDPESKGLCLTLSNVQPATELVIKILLWLSCFWRLYTSSLRKIVRNSDSYLANGTR